MKKKRGNRNYIKGRRKEYRIVNQLKQEGYLIVQRTAGSHSPIDIFAINPETHEILFIQSKPDNISLTSANNLLVEMDFLNGNYTVRFKLL